jgi:hypothetical protein
MGEKTGVFRNLFRAVLKYFFEQARRGVPFLWRFSPVGVRPFVPQMAFPPVFFGLSPFLYNTLLLAYIFGFSLTNSIFAFNVDRKWSICPGIRSIASCSIKYLSILSIEA